MCMMKLMYSWKKYLSPYLCGFRRGFSAQYCLIIKIYLNDIFYFDDECNVAGDNTPYAIDLNGLIDSLERDVKHWFNNNFMKLYEDKCHLLVSNHEEDVYATVKGSTSVKC